MDKPSQFNKISDAKLPPGADLPAVYRSHSNRLRTGVGCLSANITAVVCTLHRPALEAT